MSSTCQHNVWGHHLCGFMKREARTCSVPSIAPPPLLFPILLSALLFSLISVVPLLILFFIPLLSSTFLARRGGITPLIYGISLWES